MKRRSYAFVTAVALAGLLGVTDVRAQSPPKPAAKGQVSKSAEPITDTTRFAEHTGLFRSSSVVGTVDTERTRQRATELARQVDGVRRVVNNLRVQG